MRRFGSALSLFFMSACAHEPTRPIEHPVRAAHRSPANLAGAPALESRAADSDERELSTEFRSAPALNTLEGEASYYSDRLTGHRTASGERYSPRALTAAHRDLPLGTVLRVSRSDGTRSVYVRINDRGPFGSHRRILDLSRAAFERLGKLRAGVLDVRAEVVAYGQKRSH